ncbi:MULTISPECIES: hypothetical protein [unclassified Coleofasciculus]|uniref:slr1957 family protein n=1 Tax=unclassified Coleofasciculus TaxID=2692782 RepID=UPI00187F91AE|nr:MULTISPECIES: hypothetical protein [unclassified Coleofasciculus]MBE9127734.1 hypothetical protein [Coleofasciculus sp. LEGE 07081]MBE9150702.1 hypothetical protein [Coleofasciculus sp. LEGE 07092]
MKHYCEDWLHEWCYENGWTDLYVERNLYWAFPPGAVMPEPLPPKVLQSIKAEKGLSREEKLWSLGAVILTVVAAILSYFYRSPMPLGLAFAFAAVTVGLLEVEED